MLETRFRTETGILVLHVEKDGVRAGPEAIVFIEGVLRYAADQELLQALSVQAAKVIHTTWLYEQLRLKARLFGSEDPAGPQGEATAGLRGEATAGPQGGGTGAGGDFDVVARIYRFARVVLEIDPTGPVDWAETAHRADVPGADRGSDPLVHGVRVPPDRVRERPLRLIALVGQQSSGRSESCQPRRNAAQYRRHRPPC